MVAQRWVDGSTGMVLVALVWLARLYWPLLRPGYFAVHTEAMFSRAGIWPGSTSDPL